MNCQEVFIMVNRFVLNAISYHGKGAIGEIPGIVAAKGFRKAFIASDPDLIRFGVTKKVTDLLDAAGMAYEIYSDIKPNPTIENVRSGVAAYKASGADYMIAIGGGSSMDTGKAIGIIINNPEFADVRSLEGVAPTKNRTVFTIAVPTTAGTAAEATINYVITDVERKRKFVCVDTNDIPDVAVVDPDMMSTMPKGLTAATGMDALTHAIEGYTTKAAWELPDCLNLEAIRLISKNLRAAVRFYLRNEHVRTVRQHRAVKHRPADHENFLVAARFKLAYKLVETSDDNAVVAFFAVRVQHDIRAFGKRLAVRERFKRIRPHRNRFSERRFAEKLHIFGDME